MILNESVAGLPGSAERHRCWPSVGRDAVRLLAAAFLLPAVVSAEPDWDWRRPPRDAAERQWRWENRQAPEAIEALAKDFLDLMILDEGRIRHLRLTKREGLVQTAKLAGEEKYGEALAAFEGYFLGKLRDPQRFGLHPADVSPYGEGVAGHSRYPGRGLGPKANLKQADELLQGKWGDARLGLPGAVNWLHPHQKWDDLNPAEPGGLPAVPLLTGSAFNSLPHAYVATSEEKYLKAWAAYLDDWALNAQITAEFPHPCLVPTGLRGSFELTILIRILGGLALAIPETRQAELLPPATLARVLAKYWNELILYQALYLRTNTHNWTPSSGYLLLALVFDEFKAAPLIFREGRRRSIEDNAVTQNLRDGTENQQCPWYNHNYENGVGQVFPLFEARRRMPGWAEQPWVAEVRNDPDWFQEIREHLVARVGYQLRMLTPRGEWPIGVRGRDRRRGGSHEFLLVPEAFADPENRRLQAAVADAARPTNERLIHADSGVRPTYHSEWFPYGGYNIVREGWEADSGYGALFCSPAPGAYGGRRSRSNNNFFGVAAFGQDLVVEDKFEAYALMGSPIEVDGRPQDFHAGLTRVPVISGHKMIPAAAWTEPGYWRWHASGRFNLMEGVYEGPYAQTDVVQLKAPQVPVSMQSGGVPLDQTSRGIRHQRWVHFVRDARLWIVTDRLRGEGEHAYRQYWYLPLKPGGYHAFTEEEIEVDEEEQRVRTASVATTSVRGVPMPQANVSLHSFNRAELSYEWKAQPTARKVRPVFGQYRVAIDWKGTNDSLMVTVIYPRAPGLGVEADLEPRQLEGQNGALGFEADLPGGAKVRYLAAPGDTPVALELGAVRITGESLLVVQEKQGAGSEERGARSFRGIALGCLDFALNGQSSKVDHADFEFGIRNPKSEIHNPIFRPISPVEVGPARNVFVDEVEVTMASKTPGVEIRYTLDGSEPTPQSTRYEAPFPLRHNAVVKARAYRSAWLTAGRPGVAANPPQNSGTHATAVSRAVFSKVFALKPVSVRRSQPGLRARYFEDDWRRLWLRLDSLQPQAEKTGVAAFDLSVVPDSNPALGEAPAPREKFFAVEYRGYLEVPETGVYTLHAPREYVIPDIDPGYELRIFLGQRVEPYGWRTQAFGLNEWYPATRLHAQGNWSIALEKGLHPLRIVHLDYRTNAPARLNQPGLNDYVWSGVTPDLKISGPGVDKQPLPRDWLGH